MYFSTASFVSGVANDAANSCSGASTINVAPWRVSGLVV